MNRREVIALAAGAVIAPAALAGQRVSLITWATPAMIQPYGMLAYEPGGRYRQWYRWNRELQRWEEEK